MVTIAVDDELKPKSTPTDFNVYNAKDRKEFDEMLSIPHLYTARTRSYETEAKRQITQSQNFELTIQLRESAIIELKTIGWNLHRSNKTNLGPMMR